MHAALVAFEQNDGQPARRHALYLNGTDVLLPPGTAANRAGVPIDGVIVKENGPGGVSSMTFTITDPTPSGSGAVNLQIGQEVRFYDITNDRFVFAGWVQTWSAVPFAGVGRAYKVTAQGIEALLDWLKCANVTIPAGIDYGDAIVRAVSNAMATSGLGVPLYVVYPGWILGQYNGNGTQPIGSLGDSTGPALMGASVAVTGPKTLREVCRMIGAAANLPNNSHGQGVPDTRVTIGFDGKLRAWGTAIGNGPNDYSICQVSNAVGGVRAVIPEHIVDGGGVTRAVIVSGSGGTVYGPFTDGTNIPGDIATISDTTVANATDAAQVAGAYLQDKSPTTRGTAVLEENTPTNNVRAGSSLQVLSEPNATGFAGGPIGQLTKTYSAGGALERWKITYGGLPASFTSRVRRLTRDTLS